MPRFLKVLLIAIFVILPLVYVYHSTKVIWDHPKSEQWDLLTYYSAAQADSENLNPYLLENLVQVSGEKVSLPYTYTPLTLGIFKILTLFDYDTAHHIWLILKFLTLVLLIFLWKRYFIRDLSLLLIIPFVLFALDGSVFWDIKAGNISLFEQLAIWLAFVFYLRKRYLLFAVLITLISIFKLSPIIFIALLLFVPDKRKWWMAGGSVAALAIILLINYWIQPELFSGFINSISVIDERAVDYNYGLLPFWQDFYDKVGSTAQSPHRNLFSHLSYSVTMLAVIFFTAKKLIIKWRNYSDATLIHTIMLSCCAYILIMPRVKCYSFIIMIPACLYLIQYSAQFRLRPVILLLCLVPIASPFERNDILEIFMRYYPLYISALVWYLLIATTVDPNYYGTSEARDIGYKTTH